MLSTLLLLVASCSVALSQNISSLPIVDLGFELHQASYINSTGGYYNFSNIRYAEPPIGDLRFRAPVPVTSKRTTNAVNTGSVGRICPQANPAWSFLAADFFLPAYLTGQPFNLSAAEAALAKLSSSAPLQDPRTSEDCLFLDVVVPETIFNRKAANKKGSGAPVLVWIYGGGYTAGEKSGFGQYNPSGLIKASQVSGSEGVVFVSINYRLGAFGFLSGPTLQSDGTANAALYDQRLALQWIQHNIHLFGGDANRVTVMGESAGGGSIMHQITAFGGLKGPAPFQQAVLQSPGFQLVPGSYQQEQVFDAYLKLLNVSTLQEARQLPSSALIAANVAQVGLQSPYGLFTYGPVVDGLFTPALPGKLLLQGSFDKYLKIMVGHNADEGLLFTSPAVTNNSAFAATLLTDFPDLNPAVSAYIQNVLYPPIFDGSYGYTTEIERTAFIISESTFTCNTRYLDLAYGNKTYAYEFSVPPALHGQDIPYTFFGTDSAADNAKVQSDATAVALQEYITSFVEKGAPTGPQLPKFPLYGNNSEIQDLNATSITQIMDPTANARCAWWQLGLVY